MNGGSLRAILVVLMLSISQPVAEQPEWVVQTSSIICVWTAPCVGADMAEGTQRILDAVEDYWIPEPLPDACAPPQTSALSVYFGPSNMPLATVALYTEEESMHRDLDRFDASGLTTFYSSFYDYGFLRPKAFLDRLPEDALIHSRSLLFVCCYPDEDWEQVLAHELVHALQRIQWDADSEALSDLHNRLLEEGTARHTEYALGYLDRFDLRTAGPVSIWLAEGGDLREAPGFLLYEIGASLVDALVRRRSPTVLWAVLSGPCRSTIWDRLLGDSPRFDVAFREVYGQSWEESLDAWSSDAASVVPAPGSEHVYRWLRDAYRLRASLLAPLLSAEEIGRIETLEEVVHLGTADALAFDEIDGILQGAHGDPTCEILEALHEREATLIHYARERAGAFNEIAEVLRLGILARRGEDTAMAYVRAFIDVVNAHVPVAVQQPIADRPWR